MSQMGTGASKPTSPPGSEGATRTLAARGAIRTSMGASMPDEIARLAFHKWQKRGCPFGDGQRDWFDAEAELKSRRAGIARSG
jgi:ribonuclease I